ncbi:hypothetical protein RFI_21654 [Reticulomyxa filosa]|uniref:ER-bound oxygenase mpaB/mpaB'/Rubber oxygenase catalytic domain-containing protein n=1 Tax=Reticulomyxa filosa TaxID=46433 RepID=X6MPW0_RETFI|nr:hypothetical protein RFI_21654 [Reticulomyxa filosa]|eukprot:ETO15711.1 hypothetical protein RFI_21654 [Reticulomyxa filosa]
MLYTFFLLSCFKNNDLCGSNINNLTLLGLVKWDESGPQHDLAIARDLCVDDSIFQDVECLHPRNNGWKSILRVRLLHAGVRHRLTHKKQQSSVGTNADDANHQAIINQCHLIATLLGFQFNPLINLLTVFGLPITFEEAQCYTHLWRYVGHVLGIKYPSGVRDALSDFDTSRAWMVKIYDKLIAPNDSSKLLASHVLQAIAYPLENAWPGKLMGINLNHLNSLFRAFLAEKYADEIGIGTQLRSNWWMELQVRTIIATFRLGHVYSYLFGLKKQA